MVANSTLAKSINKRIEVSSGETKVFNHVNAANLATQDNDGDVIYNAGTVTIGDASSFTDNSISGDRGASNYGKVVFADGANLTVKAETTTISQNDVKNKGATLHLNIRNGFFGNYEMITDYSTYALLKVNMLGHTKAQNVKKYPNFKNMLV